MLMVIYFVFEVFRFSSYFLLVALIFSRRVWRSSRLLARITVSSAYLMLFMVSPFILIHSGEPSSASWNIFSESKLNRVGKGTHTDERLFESSSILFCCQLCSRKLSGSNINLLLFVHPCCRGLPLSIFPLILCVLPYRKL